MLFVHVMFYVTFSTIINVFDNGNLGASIKMIMKYWITMKKNCYFNYN